MVDYKLLGPDRRSIHGDFTYPARGWTVEIKIPVMCVRGYHLAIGEEGAVQWAQWTAGALRSLGVRKMNLYAAEPGNIVCLDNVEGKLVTNKVRLIRKLGSIDCTQTSNEISERVRLLINEDWTRRKKVARRGRKTQFSKP